MIKVLFVCHGNICRSPMAEFVFKDYVRKKGTADLFHIESAATSMEELGNDVHRGTKQKLREVGIPFSKRQARQITMRDYREYDYLIGMDEWNRRNMSRMLGDDVDKKQFLLLDFSNRPRDIADPWYTGNFDVTYDDIVEGCEAFYNYLMENGEI